MDALSRFLLLVLFVPVLGAQVNTGEIRLHLTDSINFPLRAMVTVTSQGTGFHKRLATDARGVLDLKELPYGVYLIEPQAAGFAADAVTIALNSALAVDRTISLQVAPVSTSVQVTDAATLVDPASPTSVMHLGEQQIDTRLASLPGRSLQDLVNSQPGWLYEGNAVLHPRGSEYQTQFVIDGIPFTDNRSPSFGPEIEADDVDSMSIYTAGIPAEYGRKMGGVIEINTHRETRPGTHGQFIFGGGTYDTLNGYGDLQQVAGKNTFSVTASGTRSDHYLNPVVPQNYTDAGTTGDFSARFERDLTEADTLSVAVRHELSRFEIPNELLQEQAGQLQTAGTFETVGSVRYQHVFSPDALATFSGMVRDNNNRLDSNALSTPIIATQRNDFREAYFKGTFSLHHGSQELRAGVESDNIFLHEFFTYDLTDPTQFDDGTPAQLSFADQRPDLEQSAFVEDQVRLGNWTVSAGLRYDHYQLLLNEFAFSPRVSIGRFFPRANLVLHASYDRVFQTPSFENILISSSTAIDALNADFLRLPVKPSRGNYYEGGLTKGFSSSLIFSANVYRRQVNNYADDDQLLNTGVSYPISFDHAIIYGVEGKLSLVKLGHLSGYVSYSYMVGSVWNPVTGGLFLGADADAAASALGGHFPDSQDQRNTVRARFRYDVAPRVWLAAGLASGSGLPFEFGGTEQDALAQYGPAVTNRINFDRGRIDPSLAASASLGMDLIHQEDRRVTFQLDGDNLNGRLNVIDFGGLFSGNAIAPGRSFAMRLVTSF